jgi:hypothetical protein
MLSIVPASESGCTSAGDGVPRRGSIQQAGAEEAQRFKWIESEKAGRDLGDAAIQCWVRRHWNRFVRDRWIEHLEGRAFWTELDHGDFGLLKRESAAAPLFDEIVRKVREGGENLDILCWSHEGTLSKDDLVRVLHILETLDINGHRVECEFLPALSRAG